MSEGTGPGAAASSGTAPTQQQYPPAPQGGQHGGTGNQNVNISGTGNQVAGRDIKTKQVTRSGRTVPVIGSLSIGGKVVVGTLAAAAAVGTGIAVNSATSTSSGTSGVIAVPSSVEGYARIAAPATAAAGQADLTVSNVATSGLTHPQLGEYGQAFTMTDNHGWDVIIGGNTASFTSSELSSNSGNEAIAAGFGGTEYCSDGESSSNGQGSPSCVWWNTTSVIMLIGPADADALQVSAVLARIHDGTEK